MNKTILGFCLLVLCVTCKVNSQTSAYHPMPDSNAAWCETASYGVVCGVTERKIIQMNGDTSINSVQYHKLTATGYQNCMSQYSYFTNLYEGAFREDTLARKVYMIDPSTTAEYVLYDFTLVIGDTTPNNNLGPGIRITSIDSVLVGAQFHKRYWGSNAMMMDSAFIVEGVGSSCGFLRLNEQGVEYTSRLNAYAENSMLVYVPDSLNACQLIMSADNEPDEKSDQTRVYPNPAGGLITVSHTCTERGDVEINLLDVSGRIVETFAYSEVELVSQEINTENLANGIYFVNITTVDGVVTRKIAVQK